MNEKPIAKLWLEKPLCYCEYNDLLLLPTNNYLLSLLIQLLLIAKSYKPIANCYTTASSILALSISSSCFLGVRVYTLVMHTSTLTSSQKTIVDCRTIDQEPSTIASLLQWVMNAPEPSHLHLYLPSSLPDIRKIQCTLMSLGCAVTRVSRCVPC